LVADCTDEVQPGATGGHCGGHGRIHPNLCARRATGIPYIHKLLCSKIERSISAFCLPYSLSPLPNVSKASRF
jgi:hypothetical protein